MIINRRTALLSFGTFIAGLAAAPSFALAETLAELEAAARKEGDIVSLGLPDDWANWGDSGRRS